LLNKVQFIGHLGRDPEVRYLSNGMAVCNFSVASSEKWKDKASGEMQERTEWLRCNAFDRLGEVCGEYLKKGSLVYVEGNLQTRKYTDKDGVERQVTECRLQSMKMLGGRPAEDRTETGHGPAAAQAGSRGAPAQRGAPARPAQKSDTGFDDMDDDIQF
jgi:single-strand DNA-binding protein